MNASSPSKEDDARFFLTCDGNLPLIPQRRERKRFRHVVFHFDSGPSYIFDKCGIGYDGTDSMKYDWKAAGEEWSAPWGSSAAQWVGTIFPRIRECLPAGTILEI